MDDSRVEKIVAFLPCRAGSQRVPHKNTRPFGGHQEGLIDIKLQQLLNCSLIDEVVVSSNDSVVLDIASSYRAMHGPRVRLDRRSDHLCTSSSSTDELIRYVPSIVSDGHVLWTHVTSPFFDEQDYTEAVMAYRASIKARTHSSLMTVTRLQTFIWTRDGPINYDRSEERWPRTQTLSPLYEVNSAAFLISSTLMREVNDRIAEPVLFQEVDKGKALDVDWEEEFLLASTVFERHVGRRSV